MMNDTIFFPPFFSPTSGPGDLVDELGNDNPEGDIDGEILDEDS